MPKLPIEYKNNAPTEICVGSHKKEMKFWEFFLSKKDKKKVTNYELEDNDYLIMGGEFQKHYQHHLPKRKKCKSLICRTKTSFKIIKKLESTDFHPYSKTTNLC